MRPDYRYPPKPIDNPDHISVLIPTRERPEGIRRVLENFQRTVQQKELFDVWIYVDDDDTLTLDFIARGEWKRHGFAVHWHVDKSTNSMGDMFNRLWQISSSNAGIYFPFVDDYQVETPSWDVILRNACRRYPDGIMLGYLPDPTAQPHQVTLPIPSGGWLNTLGYFITNRFYFWFEDMWVDEIAQMAERKVLIPIQVATPEGKGKTPRMRNLPFWCHYFTHTLEERYQDACAILRAIHGADREALGPALEKAKRHAAVLMHKGNGYDVEALKGDEANFSDLTRVPRNPQLVNYLQAELLAVEDLLGKLKRAALHEQHADLVELADVLKLATFVVPDLNCLKAGALEKLGFINDAMQSLDEQMARFPGDPKGPRLKAELAVREPAQQQSYYQVRSPLRLPAWIDLAERDFILFPEAADQELCYVIQWIMYRDPSIRTMLDIGAGSGEGTALAIMEAARSGAAKEIFFIEPQREKYAALSGRYGRGATILNCSSVPVEEYQSERDLAVFYKYLPGILNHYPLETIVRWRARETAYLREHGLSRDGIEEIKQSRGISHFDLVVMDGSLYCGEADLQRVYGARFLVLNYVNSIKNYSNFRRLAADDNYQMIVASLKSRCGYAVFIRR